MLAVYKFSLTSKREAGVLLSYPTELCIQEEAEVDALSLRGEGEEARRDTNGDLRLVAAETQLIQGLLRVLGAHLQDLRHTGVSAGRKLERDVRQRPEKKLLS